MVAVLKRRKKGEEAAGSGPDGGPAGAWLLV